MKSLPIAWVKESCEAIAGKRIAERTWRDWLRICEVERHKREATPEQAAYLCALANLRRDRPRAKITLSHIKIKLTQWQLPMEAIADRCYECFYTQATGRDLPTIIRQVTGRTVSTRTLYRWANEHGLAFGLSKKAPVKIPRAEIQKWIDIAAARENAA